MTNVINVTEEMTRAMERVQNLTNVVKDEDRRYVALTMEANNALARRDDAANSLLSAKLDLAELVAASEVIEGFPIFYPAQEVECVIAEDYEGNTLYGVSVGDRGVVDLVDHVGDVRVEWNNGGYDYVKPSSIRPL